VRLLGSRRYADFEDYLLSRKRWKDIRNSDGPPVAINPDLDEYLAQRSEELYRELATVNRVISAESFRTRGLRMVS
jgi:hypothetical protein